MPTTKTISIRNFRQNMSKILKETEEKKVHFVVMRHSVPVAHVTPVSRHDSLEELRRDIAKARQQVKEGKTFTVEEARVMLGL